MNFSSRLQRIKDKLINSVKTARVVEVNVWKGETDEQALRRYCKSNDVSQNDEFIFIHIKSDEQIRDERYAKGDT